MSLECKVKTSPNLHDNPRPEEGKNGLIHTLELLIQAFPNLEFQSNI